MQAELPPHRAPVNHRYPPAQQQSAAHQTVVTWATVHYAGAALLLQSVVAFTAQKHIVFLDFIGLGIVIVEQIVPRTADQHIGTATAIKRIVAFAPVQPIITLFPKEKFVTRTTVECVIAVAALKNVLFLSSLKMLVGRWRFWGVLAS